MGREKTTPSKNLVDNVRSAPAAWRLETAHRDLKRLEEGLQNEDPQVRALAQRLYAAAVTSLAAMLVATPEVFESAYSPERLFAHSDWFSTAKTLHRAARSTPSGANFEFSDGWLDALAKRAAASDGRIFSICGSDVPRALKLTWLSSALCEFVTNDSGSLEVGTRLAFLSEPSVRDDPRCQNVLGLWFSLVSVRTDIPAAYKEQILAHTRSHGDDLVLPCDILQAYFPAALPHWPMLSLIDAPLADAYALAAGSQAYQDLPAEGIPALPGNEDARWIATHVWTGATAMADIEQLSEIDLGENSHTAAIWVWSMERMAENIVANPGVFEEHHMPDLDEHLFGFLSLANGLYHRALVHNPSFSFDAEWMTTMGSRMANAGENPSLLLNMCEANVPLDTRLSWLRSSLDYLGAEAIKNADFGRKCHVFYQGSIQNESCQKMVALWLALIMDHPDITLESKISLAHYAVNDRAVGTMTPQNILRHLLPEALPHWGMIKGLGLGLGDAYVAIGAGPAHSPVTTLPALD